jgi:murein DD-endopeptidase MepM/ murein hydrolase activator NlpD
MDAAPRLEWPVAGRVTSRFGMRHGRLHEGIDIARPVGTPVHPARPGVVLLAEDMGAYGNAVVLLHGGTLATVYAHLDRVDVTAAESVERERCLGTVGTTGRSFGAHLHFEVRFDGTAVDPLVFLEEAPAPGDDAREPPA